MKNLCDDCKVKGECCWLYVIIDNQPQKIAQCIFLDRSTGSCSIYENRHKYNPLCLTIEQVIKQGTLPKECLYLK